MISRPVDLSPQPAPSAGVSAVQDKPQPDRDAELMARVGRDDVSAFDVLVKRYEGRVKAFLDRLMGHRQFTDDLAQEVFLRVYRARHRYKPQTRFSSWLFRIAANVASNGRRTLSRRREVLLNGGHFDDGQTEYQSLDLLTPCRTQDPQLALQQKELYQQVRSAVGQLSQRQRDALRLNNFQGLDHQQIAQRMQTTPKAIKSLLFRARDRLRDLLQTLETHA